MLYIIPILCTVKTPPHWVVDTCVAQDENRPQLLPWVSSRWFVCGCNTLFSEQTGFSRFKWFSRANPLLRASFAKGPAAPKSTSASPSKASVFVEKCAKSFSKDSAWQKSPEKDSFSKNSATSKSAEGNSSPKGSAYPKCIDTSYLQGVKKINAGNLMITTTWWSNIFLRFRWCQAAKLWHLIGIRSPVGIQIQGVSG